MAFRWSSSTCSASSRFSRVTKPPDLSGFPAVRGNLKFALVMIALIWILAAFGEELVHRGYLMNRVAELGRSTGMAWVTSLIVISALFGLSHYQQGLTGIIRGGVRRADLAPDLTGLSPQPRNSHCHTWSLRYHRHCSPFLGQLSEPTRTLLVRVVEES